MKLYVLILSLSVLYSCSDDKSEGVNAILNQPPYQSLTDSIKDQPQKAELYYNRASLLAQNEEWKEAEDDLKKAWSLKKEEHYALGMINVLRRKNAAEAIRFIETAVNELPQSISLRVSLARGYQQKGDLNKALQACNEIIAEYPAQLDALQLKAELLGAQNKNKEAVATLEKAYSYAPFDAELAHNLAFLYAEEKNSKVLALSDSLIKVDAEGKHAEPYYFKGIYYANTGNKIEAIKFFNQAIQHDYYFLDAYMDKGTLLYNAGQYKEALSTFKLAITVSPTFADAYYWSGKTKEALGDKQEARLDYQRAFGLDKNLKEAKEAADRL